VTASTLQAVRRRLLPILATLAAAGVVGLLIYGVTARSASRTLDERVARHEHPRAPDMTRSLPILGGHGQSSLAAYRGEVVVLNFWASWCEPCQVEAPLLERFQPLLERHHATVLGVTYLDATPDSLSFVRDHHLSYRSLRDNSGKFAHAYGTDQLPESFVLNRSGDVVAVSRGEIEEPFMKNALAIAERS
jgi:cytochrome c biogenesis protein CcmG, thiol:disulfide interchange protein DsbE